MTKDSSRRPYPLPDRIIEVIDERQTGETLLDEALKMIKSSEPMGVGSWIDLMSGTSHHTANVKLWLITWGSLLKARPGT